MKTKAAEKNATPLMDTDSTEVYSIPGIKIDSDRLLADFNNMEESLWTIQNRYRSDMRDWDGIPLYSVSGDMDDLRTADRLPVYKTAPGEKCPYICNQLLPQFNAPWLRVVFYRLKAGARIGEHRDYGENRFTAGNVRIHIPVITNERIVMFLGGKPYRFPVGTAWYFDASVRHAVENNSDKDRIHLVADFKICPGIERLLKPLTLQDRLRFSLSHMVYHLQVTKVFFQFLCTTEGRKRILARAAQIFNLSPRR